MAKPIDDDYDFDQAKRRSSKWDPFLDGQTWELRGVEGDFPQNMAQNAVNQLRSRAAVRGVEVRIHKVDDDTIRVRASAPDGDASPRAGRETVAA